MSLPHPENVDAGSAVPAKRSAVPSVSATTPPRSAQSTCLRRRRCGRKESWEFRRHTIREAHRPGGNHSAARRTSTSPPHRPLLTGVFAASRRRRSDSRDRRIESPNIAAVTCMASVKSRRPRRSRDGVKLRESGFRIVKDLRAMVEFVGHQLVRLEEIPDVAIRASMASCAEIREWGEVCCHDNFSLDAPAQGLAERSRPLPRPMTRADPRLAQTHRHATEPSATRTRSLQHSAKS